MKLPTLREIGTEARLLLIGIPVLIWTLVPIYHMFLFAISPKQDAFSGKLWPDHPTLHNFKIVFYQQHYFLRDFWIQFWNSVVIALAGRSLGLGEGWCLRVSVVSMVLMLVGLGRSGHGVTGPAFIGRRCPLSFKLLDEANWRIGRGMDAAEALAKQIERYRSMTGEQRLAIALDARTGVRRRPRRHPPTAPERGCR